MGGGLKLGSLNVQGMNMTNKRDEVESWMAEQGIDVAAIQEAHMKGSQLGRRNKYTWYF